MAYETDNTGVLFSNDKGNNPKRPDYRGECTLDGKRWKLSGWIREAKQGKNAGKRFLSIRAEPWEEEKRPQTPEAKPNPTPPASAAEDDVPF